MISLKSWHGCCLNIYERGYNPRPPFGGEKNTINPWRYNMNALRLFNPSFANDLFDAFDRDLGIGATSFTAPKVDVRETDKSYIMDMDLPGLTEKDVEISLKDRVLTISSVQEAEREEKKGKEDKEEFIIRERRSACFSRKFSLPEDIEADKVSAEFKNGVLTIDIPRRPEVQPRQIAIKSA